MADNINYKHVGGGAEHREVYGGGAGAEEQTETTRLQAIPTGHIHLLLHHRLIYLYSAAYLLVTLTYQFPRAI